MKDLPEDPPIYTSPPERWFDRHRPATSADGRPDLTNVALTKTLNAMWLILHDSVRLPLPTAERKFSAVEQEMLRKLLVKMGVEVIDIWRAACIYCRGEEPEVAFKNLLAAKGLYDQ